MNCRQARILIARRLRDGMTAREEAGIAQHLMECGPCRAEISELRSISARLSAAAPSAQAGALNTAAVWSAIAALDAPAASRRHRLSRRMAPGLVAIVAMIAALLIAPRGRHNASLAAEVAKALGRVNTWHLKGWKLKNGRQVPWEVWGRRTPFLYREQVGQDVIVDDGRVRVFSFGPDAAAGRPVGLCVRTPSVGNLLALGGNGYSLSYRSMVSERDWSANPSGKLSNPGLDLAWNNRPWHVSGHLQTYRLTLIRCEGLDDHEYFTVDERTALPTLYERRVTENGLEVTNEHLEPIYDAPMPAEIRTAAVPPGFRVVDATRVGPQAQLPTQNVKSIGGVLVQATPLGVDERGGVLIRVRGWLGGVPLKTVLDPHADLMLEIGPANFAMDPAHFTYRDDLNRRYLYVQAACKAIPGTGCTLFYIAPRQPLRAGDRQPSEVWFGINVAPSVGLPIVARTTDSYEDTRVFMEDVEWNVSLSGLPNVRSLSGFYPSGTRSFGRNQTLEAVTAHERAGEYTVAARAEARTPAERHADYEAALAYYRESIRDVGPDNDAYWVVQFELAQRQSLAGRVEEAKRTLRRIIAEGHRHTNWRGDTARAEKYLRKAARPDEWDQNP